MAFEEGGEEHAEAEDEDAVLLVARVVGSTDIGVGRQHRLQLLHDRIEHLNKKLRVPEREREGERESVCIKEGGRERRGESA